MSFKTMYLISREKYDALSRRILGVNPQCDHDATSIIDNSRQSNTVLNSERSNTSVQDKQNAYCENNPPLREDMKTDIIGKENFSFEKHVKLYDCPNLKEQNEKDRNEIRQRKQGFEEQIHTNITSGEEEALGVKSSQTNLNVHKKEKKSIEKSVGARKKEQTTDVENNSTSQKRQKTVKSVTLSCAGSKKRKKTPDTIDNPVKSKKIKLELPSLREKKKINMVKTRKNVRNSKNGKTLTWKNL